ncbi:MAG TPA: hypothetical protein VJG90_07090 [Candidatus Nanoarchaeia archaeon]|nr:hypothetical protein [Candidatus Nanoarchaeia archaeon]
MDPNQLQVPTILNGKEFYANTKEEALEACEKEDHSAIFMPQLADARIRVQKGSRFWQTFVHTPSIRATGRTKAGTAVVIYAHVPNYLSSSVNIKKAKELGLVNYAGRLPQKEFQRLVDLDGFSSENGDQLVWTVGHDVLKNASSEVIKVKNALKHPQTIPFLGGQERAEQYLEAHERIYGSNIGIWHSDDLRGDVPLGRLLALGGSSSGLYGNYDLNSGARFVGVPKVAEGAAQKTAPCLEQLLRLSADFVPNAARLEFDARLAALYK